MSSADAARAGRAPVGRVLVVTPVGLDGKGGIDRLNLYFMRAVEATGGARVDHLGSRGERPGPWWVLHFALALVRFASRLAFRRPGLVHIHVSTDGSALRKAAFGAIADLLGAPYLIHFHGMISDAAQARRPLWLRALGWLARRAQAVVVLGEAFRRPFEQALGVAPERIVVIHNGIPDVRPPEFGARAAGDKALLLFCGEVGTRKGVDLLTAALPLLAGGRWSCAIAGDGDPEPWRTMLAQAGVGDRVRFEGWVDVARAHALMREADIVVLPSRAEALPLSLIEGASAGAALVATDVGAVRDILRDGENGLIVRHDADEIAGALDVLLRSPALLARMGPESRRIYEEGFTVERYVEDVLALYRKLGVEVRHIMS